jgi:hypothetical protein
MFNFLERMMLGEDEDNAAEAIKAVRTLSISDVDVEQAVSRFSETDDERKVCIPIQKTIQLMKSKELYELSRNMLLELAFLRSSLCMQCLEAQRKYDFINTVGKMTDSLFDKFEGKGQAARRNEYSVYH